MDLARPAAAAFALLVTVPTIAVFALPAAADPAPPGWTPTVRVGSSAGAAESSLAVAGDGTAFAVWWDGGALDAYASRLIPGVGWSPAESMRTNDSAMAGSPLVAADADGNAVVVFMQALAPGTELWARRFVSGVGWTPAETIVSYPNGTLFLHKLAMGANGRAVVAWVVPGGLQELWAASLDPSLGWSAPELVTAGPLGGHALAVAPSGDALALVTVSDGTRFAVQESWRSPSAPGWSPLRPVENLTSSASALSVAFDGAGNAVSAWEWWEGSAIGVAAARYSPSVGWGEPALLSAPVPGIAQAPSLALSPGGEATVAWSGAGGSDGAWASRLAGASGWTPPVQVLASDPGYPPYCRVFAGTDGTAHIALAAPGENDTRLLVADFDEASGWGAPAPLATTPVGEIAQFHGVSDRLDNTIVAWEQGPDAARALLAATRPRVDTLPPALSVDSPAAGATIATPTVEVNGSAEPGTRVVVNGWVAGVSPSGRFAVRVALANGTNTIMVTATDAAGNQAARSVEVVHEDPAVALRVELDLLVGRFDLLDYANRDLAANLSAAELELAASQEALRAQFERSILLGDQLNGSQAHFEGLLALQGQQLNESLALAHAQNATIAALEAQSNTQAQSQEEVRSSAESASASAGLAGALAVVGLIAGGAGAAFALSKGRSIRELEDCCERWKREHGGGGPSGGGTGGTPGGAPVAGGSRAGPAPGGGGPPAPPGKDARDGHAGGPRRPGQGGQPADRPPAGPAPTSGGKASGPVTGASVGGTATGGGLGAGAAGGPAAGGTGPARPPTGGGVGSEVAKGAADAAGKAAAGGPASGAAEGVREGVREGVEAAKKGRPRG